MAGVASAEFTNRRYWGTKGVGRRSKNFSSRKWNVDRKPMKILRKEKVGRQENEEQCAMTQNLPGGGGW